jgi:histidyl-tRNA synthetase
MSRKIYQITLNFEQVLDLIKQLSQSDKIRLSQELEKERLTPQSTQLLETFVEEEDRAEAWGKWFEDVDLLKITPTKPVSEYQQLLLNKYRQQGLEL